MSLSNSRLKLLPAFSYDLSRLLLIVLKELASLSFPMVGYRSLVLTKLKFGCLGCSMWGSGACQTSSQWFVGSERDFLLQRSSVIVNSSARTRSRSLYGNNLRNSWTAVVGYVVLVTSPGS